MYISVPLVAFFMGFYFQSPSGSLGIAFKHKYMYVCLIDMQGIVGYF